MQHHPSRLFTAAATVATLAFAGACADQGPSITETELSSAAGPSFVLVGDVVVVPGTVQVCKVASSSGIFSFTASQDPTSEGTLSKPTFELHPGSCVEIWKDDLESSPDDQPTEVTVTEIVPAGWQLDAIDTEGSLAGSFSSDIGTATAKVTVNAYHGAVITFTNSETGGGEGCTPGYWRNHFDSWVGYSPNAVFNAVFGVGPASELQETIAARGGGENALLRHATAALLNAANSGVDYLYTEAQVIAMVQAAYASGDFEATKDLFVAQNEMGCPLN